MNFLKKLFGKTKTIEEKISKVELGENDILIIQCDKINLMGLEKMRSGLASKGINNIILCFPYQTDIKVISRTIKEKNYLISNNNPERAIACG